MNKFLKKGIAVSALGFTLLAGFAQTNAHAASNHSDKEYYFEFDDFNSSASQDTGSRVKYNTTSVYMKSNYVGGDYKFSGHVRKSDGTDVSGGKRYSFGDGTTQYMTNYAVEKYGSGVKVKVRGEAGWNVVRVAAGGVWSPDSV
ncbi:hypothetical protein [Bacillus manliponensis]|uniref:hypothetical protein n=1 Tax=Bacillus manliponensis TaxID=574376 RepID=UPI0035196451